MENIPKSNPKLLYIYLVSTCVQSGKQVEGTVRVNCQQDLEYEYVNIRFIGIQKCQGAEQNQKGKYKSEANSKQKVFYKSDFTLAKFKVKIPKGSYAFPFSLSLPNSLPPSVEIDESNSISYSIIAQLFPFENMQRLETYGVQMSLKVIESRRISIESINFKEMVLSQCCMLCCFSSGDVEFTLKIQKQILKIGEAVKYDLRVNNLNPYLKIDHVQFFLEEIKTQILNGDLKQTNQRLLEFLNQGQIPKGEQRNFTGSLKISNPRLYTVIGVIFARTYRLGLVAHTGRCGCCGNNPSVGIDIVIISGEADHSDRERNFQGPPQQNVRKAGKAVFKNSEPFEFPQGLQIKFQNQLPPIKDMGIANSYPSPNNSLGRLGQE